MYKQYNPLSLTLLLLFAEGKVVYRQYSCRNRVFILLFVKRNLMRKQYSPLSQTLLLLFAIRTFFNPGTDANLLIIQSNRPIMKSISDYVSQKDVLGGCNLINPLLQPPDR